MKQVDNFIRNPLGIIALFLSVIYGIAGYVISNGFSYLHGCCERIGKFFPRRSHPAQPWRRPLMVRQPYSVAVLSTGGRLHPSFLRREGLVRMWSSLWLKGDGGIRKMPFLMVKKDGMILEILIFKNTKIKTPL